MDAGPPPLAASHGRLRYPPPAIINIDKFVNIKCTHFVAKNASPVDKVKYHICEKFVIYKNNTKVTQKSLAQRVETDEAIMSKILHYNIEEFTIDRLVKFLAALYPGAEVKIEVAS